jgi:hypothetical protein
MTVVSSTIFPLHCTKMQLFFLVPEYVRYYYCKQVPYDKQYLLHTAIIPLGKRCFILDDNSWGKSSSGTQAYSYLHGSELTCFLVEVLQAYFTNAYAI